MDHLGWLSVAKLEPVSKFNKISDPAIFDYTWYHGLPIHCDKIVVKRDIHRKIFAVVSIHIVI